MTDVPGLHLRATPARCLTPRQKAVLACITGTVAARGYPPSLQEVADAVGLASTSSVRHILERLQAKGHIKRVPGLRRAVTVTHPPAEGGHRDQLSQ